MNDEELKKKQEAGIPTILNAMLGQVALVTFIYFFIFSTSPSDSETSGIISLAVLVIAVLQICIGLFLAAKYRAGDKN